jgi:acyl carrier protein
MSNYFNDEKENRKMLERVIEIIQEQLNLDGVEINEDSSFKDDLGADSLDLFELVMAFEEEYGVEIPSEDLEQITTVGAVVEYMKSKGVEA